MRQRVLFVDDEPSVLQSLKWLFADEPWEFHGIRNPVEALDLLGKMAFAVVVADQRMGQMPGTDFLEKVRSRHPDTLRIIATAYADHEVAINAINRGQVFRFLPKPWDDQELKQTIRNAVSHYELVVENRRLVSLLQEQNETLKQVNEKLGKTIAVRARKIEMEEAERKALEAKLLQAQRMEAIGTFAGGIAHDFNNILAAIMGYAELAKLSAAPGSQAIRYLEHLENAGSRGKELVKQILGFSRQRHNKPKSLKIHREIRETVNFLSAVVPSFITIREKIDDCGMVVAEKTQINQIVMNLCTNAYHAMEETGGTLTVSLSPVEVGPDQTAEIKGLRPGRYADITVSDTGSGIDSSVLERIFQPHFTTKTNGKGTGLGLSVVQGIVQHLNGTITFESQPGQGSEFSVLLPLVDDKSSDEVPAKADVPGGKERILFIDDEPSLVEIGKQTLENLGYAVTAVNDSTAALELFSKEPGRFDLVITDMTMPKMTGDDLAEKLMAVRSDIPVILCTGYSERISEEKAIAQGIRAYALKPLIRRDLAETIRRVLDAEKC